MKHIVMFSGGIGSWAAAKRVAERHGTAEMVLLFCDTRTEDEDTYRWLGDAAANVGAPLTRIADGRSPWEVFADEHIIGNARVAPCSSRLKQRPARAWLAANTDPAETIAYFGYDWSERHRLVSTRAAMAPWRVEAPMTEPPYLLKAELLAWSEAEGVGPQRLYTLGFAHANCGGRCIRAGVGHWLHLLRVMPARYAEMEAQEQAQRERLGKDVSILRDRTGGTLRPLTLRALRQRFQAQPEQCDMFTDDIGGCGCFTEATP